ncbi:scavenger receptor cysteine-rich domain-containing protein DMBT1-like isoform X3 [Oculina patagonica]
MEYRTALVIVQLTLVSVYSRKSFPTLSDNRISLQCLHDFMLLEMDLQDIPKLEPTSLHLRHYSCRPQVTNTRAIFRVPFQGCGTTLGTELEHIVYENVVDNSPQINGSRVTVRHAPELHYPFACRYQKKYIVTLKEGQEGNQGHENGQEKGNRTREDAATSSVSSSSLHHFSYLFIGFQLLGTLIEAMH